MNINIDIENLTVTIASMVKAILDDVLEEKGIPSCTYDSPIRTKGEKARELKVLVNPIKYLVLDAMGVEQEEQEVKVSISLAEMGESPQPASKSK